MIKKSMVFIGIAFLSSNMLWAMKNQESKKVDKPIYEILAEEGAAKIGRFPWTTDEEHAQDKKERYDYLLKRNKICEESFANYKKYIKESPLESMWGGINYSMTLDEMKKAVKAKFQEMKKQGLIISEQDFAKIKNQYYDKPSNNLSRIWGADYLRQKIHANNKMLSDYDVPEYIIVVDNPSKIGLVLSFALERWPTVAKLTNGYIYFKNIEGEEVGNNAWALKEIYYDDVGSDPKKKANVIQDEKTGKKYIVDTEFKSFEIPSSKSDFVECQPYYYRRFLHNNKFDLTEKYEFTLN